MNEQTQALGNGGSTPLEKARATDEGFAFEATALQELRALPVPPGDAARLAAIYAPLDATIALGAQLSAAFRASDDAAVARVTARLDALATTLDSGSAAYGLSECAKL